jgi:hypothetical protein
MKRLACQTYRLELAARLIALVRSSSTQATDIVVDRLKRLIIL